MKKIILSIFILMLATWCHGDSRLDKTPGLVLANWIDVQLKLVRTARGVPHPAFSRHFAYTALAAYEATIPSGTEYKSFGKQLQGLGGLPAFRSSKSLEAVASCNAAYAAMMRYFYAKNSNASLIDSLENATRASVLQSGVSAESIQASEEFGRQIAKAIITWAEGDQSNKASEPYTAPIGEGLWQTTPPNFVAAAVPFWRNNRSMIKGSGLKTITTTPPPYSKELSSAFYAMVKEVYDVSQKLTEEQTAIAWFWDDSPGKFLSAPGHWSSILSQIIKSNNLPLSKAIEADVKMHLCLYDAAIVAFDGKYTYNVVRPITYIQKNIDAHWQSLIETPPHPEFPAAHAVLSSAAATGLTDALGRDVSFTDASYQYLGMAPRSFSSPENAAQEAGLSRLYGGIHYRFSIEQGLLIGKRTAQNVLSAIHCRR